MHEVEAHVVGQVWRGAGGWRRAEIVGGPARQFVGGAARLMDNDVFQRRHRAVAARQQEGQHEVHHAYIGADADHQDGARMVGVAQSVTRLAPVTPV